MNAFNQSTLYILLWCIYKVGSGNIFIGGGIISQVLMLIIILLSFWNLLYAITKYKLPLFLKAIACMICYFTIYGVVPIINNESFTVWALDNYTVPSYNYLKLIYMSLLPVFPFFVYSKKGYLTEKVISRWFYVFLALVLLQYIRNIQTSVLNTGNAEGEFTNNVAYSLVSLLPLMLFLNIGTIRKYFILGMLFLLILYGMKRGAIVIAILTLIWYIYRTIRTESKTTRFKFVLLFSIFLTLISVFTVHLYNTNSYFQYRIGQTIEGNVSGRDLIIENLLYHFNYQATPIQKLFGFGANATLKIGVNYAHNDWVEILINQGIIGVIFYILYWFMLYRSWKNIRRDTKKYTIIGMVLLNIFLSSFFSMSYSTYSLYMALCIGYCFATNQHNTKLC